MEEVAGLKKRSDIIVMQNPMPIMLMDPSFKIIMANEAYTSLTGLSKEKLHGMNAREFKILSQTGEGLKKVITEKRRSFGEITIEFPTGIRILEQFGIPMMDAQQNLSTILCVYVDVTDRRAQEKKIQEMMEEAKASAELLSASAAELQTGLEKIAPAISRASSALMMQIRSYPSRGITTLQLRQYTPLSQNLQTPSRNWM